ncbi:hypothetical protein KI688_009479 [Linnemannia hyalina]|uniref:cDENN domain-containing protein n=1 Tax=Linnemannia hyalina TaxID=64524 RepID=A0A9P7Y0X9_9FUNG|nr:hypothetical protein KI688_009479 [Linnemannia hyalina]
MRHPSGAVHAIKRPTRRSVTMSDISQQGSTGLHHRASYRHISAGTLYKSVQEGIQQGLARERIQEDDGKQNSESEMEYVKAIKTKITREKSLLRTLNERLREERTLGRRTQIIEIKRDIADSEEKLSLLRDQMEPWKQMFVDAEDVMLAEGKVIFLSSHLGMLTLAAESFLYMFFPLYWQGVYIPILPAALMTCLQAPVPYIIGACVVDLDKGTIDVQLAPMQLPARPRRKLVQSLEMYAPTSAVQRNPNSQSAAFGPPEYVKFAYPHSRLTLFCGVSRAPRMGRRSESLRPPAPSNVSTITAVSVQGSLAGASRNSSTHTLNQPSAQNPPALPKIPKMDFGKETLLEGGLMGLELDDVLKGKEAISQQSDSMLGEIPGRPLVFDSKVPSNKVAPEQDTTETVSTATRKVLSPQRSRANVFEMPRRQEGSTEQRLYVHQTGSQQDTSKISMESGPHLRTGDGSSRLLSHRASVTSIESSNSSLWLKSSSTGMSSAPKNGSPIVLQMWAGILRGYRTGILAGQQYLQPFVQAQSPRTNAQAKQLSSTGSEGEKGVQERISWASFRGWTSRSSANNSPSPVAKGPDAFSPPSNRAFGQTEPTQQPITRARSGTNGSIQSDTVRFHREVFMKNVDKDAKVFMVNFTESQAFVQFVQDRVDRSPGDPEIMFFDEVIKAKMNRSRFRLGKEETKFLDDPSYGIQGTIKAPPPMGEHETFVSEDGSKRFPVFLDPAKF